MPEKPTPRGSCSSLSLSLPLPLSHMLLAVLYRRFMTYLPTVLYTA